MIDADFKRRLSCLLVTCLRVGANLGPVFGILISDNSLEKNDIQAMAPVPLASLSHKSLPPQTPSFLYSFFFSTL